MNTRRISAVMMLALLPVWSLSACASESKVKVREPLTLSPSVPPTAQQYTSQGSSAYLTGQYDQAKSLFAQAVSAAPNSGEARYNLGLALFKLGDTEAAREQFIQAAIGLQGSFVGKAADEFAARVQAVRENWR